jgi:hypothetical protein
VQRIWARYYVANSLSSVYGHAVDGSGLRKVDLVIRSLILDESAQKGRRRLSVCSPAKLADNRGKTKELHMRRQKSCLRSFEKPSPQAIVKPPTCVALCSIIVLSEQLCSRGTFQMASRLLLMLRHPWKTLAFSWMSIRYLSLALADRLLFPFACRPISFYTEITRCLLGSSLACFLELTFSAPPGLRTDEYQPVELNNVSTIVVPRETKLETLGSAATPRTVVLLYAHGGGYLFGEPLMYLDSYKRWTKEAESVGIRLVVVSVDYRGLPKLPTMKSLES